MNIAVIGMAAGKFDKTILAKTYKLGKEIASQKCTLLSGGCRGYPYMASIAAMENNGKSTAISPAKNKKEHISKYGFATDYTKIIFTGEGIPKRNFTLISKADAAIVIGGKVGTLNEFTIAFHRGIPIGVLKDSGGITELLPEIAMLAKRLNYSKVFYDTDPVRLVRKVTR